MLAFLLMLVASAAFAQSGITNKGKYMMLGCSLRGVTQLDTVYLALVTGEPTVDTNTMSDLTEINIGNGYAAGGFPLACNNTFFDVLTEDDTNDRALIQVYNVVWTASGGAIPNGGSDARWAVLTDKGSPIADREVYAWFDLVSGRSVSDAQTLTLENCELRIDTP